MDAHVARRSGQRRAVAAEVPAHRSSTDQLDGGGFRDHGNAVDLRHRQTSPKTSCAPTVSSSHLARTGCLRGRVAGGSAHPRVAGVGARLTLEARDFELMRQRRLSHGRRDNRSRRDQFGLSQIAPKPCEHCPKANHAHTLQRPVIQSARSDQHDDKKCSGSSWSDIYSAHLRRSTMVSMNYRAEDRTSRRVIDVAVGILVGLRDCSQRQAFEELVAVATTSRRC